MFSLVVLYSFFTWDWMSTFSSYSIFVLFFNMSKPSSLIISYYVFYWYYFSACLYVSYLILSIMIILQLFLLVLRCRVTSGSILRTSSVFVITTVYDWFCLIFVSNFYSKLTYKLPSDLFWFFLPIIIMSAAYHVRDIFTRYNFQYSPCLFCVFWRFILMLRKIAISLVLLFVLKVSYVVRS